MEQISIKEIEQGIADLRAAEAKLMAVMGFKPTKRNGKAKHRKSVKVAGKRIAAKANGITDKQLQARKRQGLYLSSLRGLSAANRRAVSKARQSDGFIAAIKLAKSLSA